VVSFEGVATREGAEQLTGLELYVRRDQLPKLGDGEYYCCDLIGFTVVSESGPTIGILRNVLATASNDIYEIAGAAGEVLLPAIPDVVIRVDLKERRITVRPPEVVDAL
jgi:16S rRNA processing protein RimM